MSGRLVLGIGASLALAGCNAALGNQSTSNLPDSSNFASFVEECESWDDWDKPTEPFNIYGNTFYVGTCGISAILVVAGEEHFLVDSGTEAGAGVVLQNLDKLALQADSIALLLHSHEHFDHVGGHARVVEATGAGVVASVVSSAVLASGLDHPEDPQAGMHEPMAPVRIARTVRNGDVVTLGAVSLKAIETPGHTPGALSWQWESCEDSECRTIVYADSLSPVSRDDYRFSDHPDYVAKYRAGLERLREVKCDVLLTPHPSASRMLKRAATGSMVGGMTCVEYADAVETRLNKRLLDETASD